MDTLLLLPGLDGTGRLFSRLIPELEGHFNLLSIAYPSDRILGAEAAVAYIQDRIPERVRYAIVAESFSGPLAIEFAARRPPGLLAIILVATFVSPPLGWLLRALLRAFAPLVAAILLRPSAWAMTYWLSGGEASLNQDISAALASVKANVIVARLQALCRVDARESLSRCEIPILYLAGDRDRLVDPRYGREIARLGCNVTLGGLPAPHLVLQSQPRLAAKAIRRFLSSLTPSPSEPPGNGPPGLAP
ncbi:MAG: alpha/beta hydrolase [Fibrobacteria bacterium]